MSAYLEASIEEANGDAAFIAKALIRQDPFEVWGSGEQDRNFTFVGDIVDGLLLAAQKISDCRAADLAGD